MKQKPVVRLTESATSALSKIRLQINDSYAEN